MQFEASVEVRDWVRRRVNINGAAKTRNWWLRGPPTVREGGRSVEKAAQRMTINGQEVPHKPSSEGRRNCLNAKQESVDNPKRALRC
jgi:hypothetical protein